MAEKYRRWSPYNYVENNSIRLIDPDGMAPGDSLQQMQVRGNRASNLQGMVKNHGKRPHQGFDLTAAPGTNVMAVKDGSVYKVVNNAKAAYGNKVEIKMTGKDSKVTYAEYAHLSKIDVKVGQNVKKGSVICETGMTGNAINLPLSQAYLHFELRSTPSPGKGLGGRLDPNSALDTKFYSQDAGANQTLTGVIKVETNGDRTYMNTNGTSTNVTNPTPTYVRSAQASDHYIQHGIPTF